MIHIHDLDGCAPVPLAHYLKALGILRLVAEDEGHGDPDARGWWEDDRFRLASKLSREELEEFFLEWYQPTPLLAPWNGASGFFKTWDAKAKKLRKSKNAEALQTILSAGDARWGKFGDAYQLAVDALGKVLKEVNVAELPEKERKNSLIVPKGEGPVFPVANKDDDKAKIQQTMMRSCAQNEFYRSAIVDMGDATPVYPSLWGSGGNDGAIDFTARYFENLIQAFIEHQGPKSKAWLVSSLAANPATGLLSGKKGKVGQFLPGGAGGANSTAGPGSQDDTLLNPWDFILMMEGASLFTANATRRLGASEQARAASPFAVNAHGAGYASAADTDESARGEQWMPLWSQPISFAEFKRLLAEGRAQIGKKPAREPLELARSVARLGTARGIASFQRFGYIERNGQSNLAVPLGRFRVPEKIQSRLTCLDDLDREAWLHRLGSVARSAREEERRKVPARLRIAERRLTDALFAVTQHPDDPLRWQAVMLELAAVEAIMVTGSGYKAGPVPRLRPEWVTAASDGTSEFRLALSLALQARGFIRETRQPIGTVRQHWLPLEKGRFATTATGVHTRLRVEPEVVMHGRRGIDDAIALVERRLIEAGQRGERSLPLVAAKRAAAHPADLAALLAGEVDLDRTLALARALMALDGLAWGRQPLPPVPPRDSRQPDDAWLAVRLALLPWPIPDGRRIGADPAIFRRLLGGDAAGAVELALRRLRAAGISATVRAATVSPETARLWAAALAFPISQATAEKFLFRLDPSI